MSRLPGSLLYVSDGDIYKLDPHGDTTRLTYSHDNAMPQMSPDGRTLAYVRFTIGLHKYDKYAADIWLMDLATRRQHILTHGQNKVPANNLWAVYPSWTPDSKSLVFSSDRAKLAYPPSDARETNLAVWSTNTKGSSQTQLTFPDPLQSAGGDNDPAWRPHSRQFVYVHWAYPNQTASKPGSQLVLENVDTHTAYGITAMSAGNNSFLQPSWSPDGRRLVYIQRGLQDSVVLAQLGMAHGRTTVLSSRVLAAGKVAQPAFTPDGRWISFLQASGDSFSTEAVNVSTGLLRSIDGVDSHIDARWRPVWVH
jgi:Tol biopolymer transport system component